METIKTNKALSEVLIRPIMSEKAMIGEGNSQYTFYVAKDANKIDVKAAVRAQYGVLPKRVHMLNIEGKRVQFGRRKGRRNDMKKAVVFLAKGQTIAIHEGV